MQKAECKRQKTLLSAYLSAFCILHSAFPASAREQARTGFTAAPTVARAYDLILNADFDGLAKALPATCPPAPSVACTGLEALSLWWQIQLDPESKTLDAAFVA